MWMIWGSVWVIDLWAAVEQTPLTTDADVAVPAFVSNLEREEAIEYSPRQELVKTLLAVIN